jgi:hypothetical protein
MTLRKLASWSAVNDMVGKRPSKRWGRACLNTCRSDGYSIAGWFQRHHEERIRLVREAILDRKPWSPLLRAYIAKKPGSSDLRAIDMPTVLDQAVMYLLHDWLEDHAEDVLTKIAVGFRRGVQMYQTILNARATITKRPFVTVVDIANFFDSISWPLIDRVIQGLPADQDVQDFLRSLVRLEVVERRSGSPLARQRGIPQGLSISPVLANLVLNRFDQRTGHGLSKSGVWFKRYCDDMILPSSTAGAGGKAVEVVGDRLSALGLGIKPGTGRLVDTREVPAVWLGISFGPNGLDVPKSTIVAKATRLQAKLEQGILGPTGIEDSLMNLDQHYRRIIGSERSQEVILSIKGRLDLSVVPRIGKEGIDRLRELIGGQHDRGHNSRWVHSRGEPDDLGEHQAGRQIQDGGAHVSPEGLGW